MGDKANRAFFRGLSKALREIKESACIPEEAERLVGAGSVPRSSIELGSVNARWRMTGSFEGRQFPSGNTPRDAAQSAFDAGLKPGDVFRVEGYAHGLFWAYNWRVVAAPGDSRANGYWVDPA